MKIIPTLLFLLLLLSFLSGCQQKDKAARQPEMTVRVAQAVLLKEQTPKEFSFIAKPFRTSELSFRVGGPISNFEVYAGNYYRKGEVIATIDDRDFLIRILVGIRTLRYRFPTPGLLASRIQSRREMAAGKKYRSLRNR